MTHTEIQAAVEQAFRDVEFPIPLSANWNDSPFVDSLIAVEMWMHVEETFSVEIDDKHFEPNGLIKSGDDLVRYLADRLGE